MNDTNPSIRPLCGLLRANGLLTKTVTTPFVLSALRSKAYRSMNGVATAVFRLKNEMGDFVVRRADGIFAYQLAVVVDDAAQNITHVVRGADLLASTPRQIYLQGLLNFATPGYMHLPIAVNAQGEKLSKQTLAEPVNSDQPVKTLLRALTFLRQNPPDELADSDLGSLWHWAITNWSANNLTGIKAAPVSCDSG